MIRFTFKKGLVFREGLKRWTIIGRTAFGKIKLECDEGEPRTMSRDELYQAVLLNTMSIDEQSLNVDPNVLFTAVPRDLSTFPKHHQQNARRRHIYMQELTDSFTDTNAWIREQTAKIAAEIGDTVVPSVSSIKRWWRQLCDSRTSFQLIWDDGARNFDAVTLGTHVSGDRQRRSRVHALRHF